MNGLPYYKAYPRDFFEGTRGMPGELKGAYRMMLDLIYQHGGKLPYDLGHIAGEIGYGVRRTKAFIDELQTRGKLDVNEASIENKRATRETLASAEFVAKQRLNGSSPKKNNGLTGAVAKPRHKPKRNHTDKDIYTPPYPPRGGLSKMNGKGNPFPADFPYDHRLTFAENRKALDAWKAAQEQPA